MSKYIEIIEEKIESCAAIDINTEELTLQYYNELFNVIKDDIKKIAEIFNYPTVDDITLEKYYHSAKNNYLSKNPIDINPCNSITRLGFKTWLTEKRKTNIKWNYTDRYFRYLEDQARSQKVLDETEQSSLNIMEKLGDPKSETHFYTKGLVVGEVQSGKTANFNAVINRAIDCGYELIIVLSGIMDDLRKQTQERIESDVIGEGRNIETDRLGVKGVGNKVRFGNNSVEDKINQVFSVTSINGDFNRTLADADFQLSQTNILVCKKNVSVLRNLIVWLHDSLGKNKAHNIPFLILDDEADNASLNNMGSKGKDYASKINAQIRSLLGLFNRKTYLGYTATPFANVLQDRNTIPTNKWKETYRFNSETRTKELSLVDNISPEDFIVLLNPPTNYVGAKQIFETIEPIDNKIAEKIPLYEVIKDHIDYFPTRVYINEKNEEVGIKNIINKYEWDEDKKKNGNYLGFETFKEYRKGTYASKAAHNFPKDLPTSLKEALLCFILALAVKESRKPSLQHSVLYNPHNTMLIHISRFTKWQNNTKFFIDKYLETVISSINSDSFNAKESIYKELETIWYKYYSNIIESIKDYLRVGYVDEFMTPIVFESLKIHIPEAINGLEVKAINSVTQEKLDYPKNTPKKIIAIGGNRLSRGFTLEGLTINYFVRDSNYSDTLLQMGRWFGYRPGYLDCCKLFTTQNAIDKYDLITKTIEELEIEFRKMEREKKSPRNFALKVKKHPGTLKVTRESILKNTKIIQGSYQDKLEMTTEFDVSKEKIESVWNNFKKNIAPLFKKKEESNKSFLTFKASADLVINILEQDNNFKNIDKYSLINFIKLCKENKQLTDWTVALKVTGRAKKEEGKGFLTSIESNLPVDVNLAIRRAPSKKSDNNWKLLKEDRRFKATGSNANITSSTSDLSLALEDYEIKQIEKNYRKEKREEYKKTNPEATENDMLKIAKTVPEKLYREKMKEENALLIIYLFDSYYSFKQERGDEDNDMKKIIEEENYDLNIPLVGYALGFPPLKNDPSGDYYEGDYDLIIEEEEDLDESEEELPEDSIEVLK